MEKFKPEVASLVLWDLRRHENWNDKKIKTTINISHANKQANRSKIVWHNNRTLTTCWQPIILNWYYVRDSHHEVSSGTTWSPWRYSLILETSTFRFACNFITFLSVLYALKPLMSENELHHNGSFTAVPSSLLSQSSAPSSNHIYFSFLKIKTNCTKAFKYELGDWCPKYVTSNYP